MPELITAESPDGVVLEGFGETSQQAELETVITQAEERKAQEPEKVQRPSRAQKRFDELTAERESEKRNREAAERERDTLRAELEAARRAQTSAREPERQIETREAPKPAKFEKTFDQFVAENPDATYEDYIDARAEFRAQQLLERDIDARIRASIEADRASRTRQESITSEVERGRKAYPDFDAVVQAPHMMTNNWPQWLVEAIMEQPNAEHIRYELGKDPARAEKVRTMNPIQFGMELARFTAPAVAPLPASTAATDSVTPPKPYQPVGSGSRTTSPSSADLGGDEDYDASGYREKRRSERGLRR